MHSEDLLNAADGLENNIKSTFDSLIKGIQGRRLTLTSPLEIHHKGRLILVKEIKDAYIYCEYKEDGDRLIMELGNVGSLKDRISLISKMEAELIGDYEIHSEGIFWSTEDFNMKASDVEQVEGYLLYDRRKFKETLSKMIKDHDCNVGITWEVVEDYLDEYCKL